MKRALSAMMKGYEYQSEFAKKYVAQGEAKGRADAALHALLTVLRVRGIAVSDAHRARISAEQDLARLRRWLERAVVAASMAEVFDEPSRAA